MKKKLSILLITFLLSANSQDSYFPGKNNWEVKSPREFNYDSKKIQKIAKNYGFKHKVLIWEHEHVETSIQEKARKARYQLMLDYVREENIDTILTAHTSDDNIETFIMRLAKGSGLDGLKSINKIRFEDGINIRRPLLALSRSVITEILISTDNKWIDDPTNDDEIFERVRIRNNINSLSKFNIFFSHSFFILSN